MAIESLTCRECGTAYPLEARYVCERCFGPLEVAYDHAGLDPDEARRKIQAGPAGTERVVGGREHGNGMVLSRPDIAGHVQRGGGTGPMKPRQPPRAARDGANS